MMVVQLNWTNYSEIASKIIMFHYIIEVIANRQMCLTMYWYLRKYARMRATT